MADDDGLAQCPQAVVDVLDVVEHRNAAEIRNRPAAVMAAEVERPGVPAGVRGRVEPGAEIPAAPVHAVDEEQGTRARRPGGRRVLEEEVADLFYGETAFRRTVSSTMEAVVWRSLRSTHSFTVWMSRMPQPRLAISMPRVA